MLVRGKTWRSEVHGRTPSGSSEFDEPNVSARISRGVHENGKQGALRGVLEDRIEDGWTKVALSYSKVERQLVLFGRAEGLQRSGTQNLGGNVSQKKKNE